MEWFKVVAFFSLTKKVIFFFCYKKKAGREKRQRTSGDWELWEEYKYQSSGCI